jgi:excisionase family DNA binding protein
MQEQPIKPLKRQPVQPVAFGVMDWCQATSLGRSTVYRLMDSGEISFVCVGRRRLITTSPQEFIKSLQS